MVPIERHAPPESSALQRAGTVVLRVCRGLAYAAGLALLLAGIGFLSFVHAVPTHERTTVESADAIVALTGGAERLADAITLLAEGRAKRLLISGVNLRTSEEELVRQVPRYAHFAACCIDLDRRAANTLGNALETGRWVRGRAVRSLIVVTSGYHMPRALMELEREIPDVHLIPYPVVTERLKDGAWWRDLGSTRLMLAEYVKYLAALARVRVSPPDEPAAAHADLRL